MHLDTQPRLLHRLLRLMVGLVLFGMSIALMLRSALGVDSWDVFHQGLAQVTGISFGWVVNGVSLIVLAGWIPLRTRPGFGTFANAAVVGLVADATLALLQPPGPLVGRAPLLVAGIILNGVATGLYIGAGLGAGPRDGLMTGLAARTGLSIGSTRTGIEITVLAAGWMMGGPVGIGTVLYAVAIGPLTQFFLDRFSVDRPQRPTPCPVPAGTA